MQANNYKPDFTDWYIKQGVAPPSSATHGSEEDIRSKLKTLKPHRWHMEGNKLVGETEMGRLVQFIDPSYICIGSDDKGLPLLKKIEL